METTMDQAELQKLKKLKKESASLLADLTPLTQKTLIITAQDYTNHTPTHEKPFKKDNIFRYYDSDKSYAMVRKAFMWLRRNKEWISQQPDLKKDALEIVNDLAKVRFDIKGDNENYGFTVEVEGLQTLHYMKIVPWALDEAFPWSLFWVYQTAEPSQQGKAVLEYLEQIDETFAPYLLDVIQSHVSLEQFLLFLQEMKTVLEAKEAEKKDPEERDIHTEIALHYINDVLAHYQKEE